MKSGPHSRTRSDEMIEILGTMLTEAMMWAACIGSLVGAILAGFTLYIVAKVKRDMQKNKAVRDGEQDREASVWYKAYTYALFICIALAFFTGVGAAILLVHMGWVHGAIEVGAAAGLLSIVGAFVWDTYLIHPIADGKFVEQVELPIVGVTFQAAEIAVKEMSDDEALALAEKLKQLKADGKL